MRGAIFISWPHLVWCANFFHVRLPTGDDDTSVMKAKAYFIEQKTKSKRKPKNQTQGGFRMPHVAPAAVLKRGSIYLLHLRFAFHGSFPPTFPLLRQCLLPSSHCYCGETGSMRPRNASIDRFQHTHTHTHTFVHTQTHTVCPASFAGHCIWHVATISLTLHTHTHIHARPLPDSCLGRQLLLSKEALALPIPFFPTCSLSLSL